MQRLQPEKPGTPTYRQIWRIVDGAVASAFAAHPDYVASSKRVRTVRNSIVKRVVGAINGYAEQSAWVRSGFSPADESAEAAATVAAEKACCKVPSRLAVPTGEQAGEVSPSPAPS